LRLFHPEPVTGFTVMAVAAVGIVINGATAWLFASGRKRDLNIKGAYLHMAADAAVSAAVVIAGGAMLLTGWLWIDPLMSLAVVAVIVWSTWSLLRDSIAMSMNAVPSQIEPDAVSAFLMRQAGVADIHDLHIWPMSTTETALTVHLVMPTGHPGDGFILHVAEELRRRYSIGHVSLQVEIDGTACPLAPAHVV
jgi:cobalt-zinc-cadmium efflux system protein